MNLDDFVKINVVRTAKNPTMAFCDSTNIERCPAPNYTKHMDPSQKHFSWPSSHRLLDSILLVFVITIITITSAFANQDIYNALPEDVEVKRYIMKDLDGDSMDEIGILYQTEGGLALTVFQAQAGRWARWWDLEGSGGNLNLQSFDLVDVNGNGSGEILINFISPDRSRMFSRVLSLKEIQGSELEVSVLLEDFTSPAGYPVLGDQEGRPSVTFLDMGSKDKSGHRRVYCWDGSVFEKCLEVPWGVIGNESRVSSPESQVKENSKAEQTEK